MKIPSEQRIIAGKLLKRMGKFLPVLIFSLVLSLIYVCMTLLIPILAGRAIDGMLGPGQVQFEAIGKILLQIGLCAAGAALCQWGMTSLNNQITFRVTRGIRDEAFAHIQQLPLSYLDRQPRGDLVSRMIADVDTFADGLLLGFSQLFTGVMTIAGTLIFMLRLSWQIALVVILITPVSLLVARFIATRTFSMFRQQNITRGEQTSVMEEAISELKVVHAFGREAQILDRFDEVNQRLERCSLRATFYSSLTNPCTRFVNSLVYAGVGLAGALSALMPGGITIGTLTSFLSYANQYTKPFNEISGVITELQNAFAAAGRIFELIEAPAQTPDPETAPQTGPVQGNLEIQNLNFSYTPENPLIQGLNLSVRSGMQVAIVGPTGCGKTTFLNLLMRFYDPQEGKILLDGRNTRDISRGMLRENIGMVLQDTWLKAGTIRENIALGKPDATLEEIQEAARKAHAHSFIRKLPQGYDTPIGESGGSLSQGQKQLLCIARVILSLPPMLFLDEATSSIDTRTEMQIQKAFDSMTRGRTTFIVAHRLSTVRNADRILVMAQGSIVEQGTHEELLAQNGLYAQLYNSQFAH